MTTFSEVARAAQAAGICVLPPKQDGSKAPDALSWTEYQRRLPTDVEVTRWYDDPRRAGIGYVCGRISGGLELLDFDDHASAWDDFQELVEDNGLGDLWTRITSGYLERTPAGGYHVLFRSPHPSGAIKLAQRPKRPSEMQHGRDRWQPLIETKGEGGYVIAAPTNGAVHPSGGRYELLNGGVDSIATLTAAERDSLLAVARMLDQKPRPVYGTEPSTTSGAAQGDKPGDRYNAQTSWDDLLPLYGWRIDHRRGVTTYWTRPGKDQGVSASTNHQGNDLLWPFSSSTDLDPDRSYDRFGFYAVMEHGGDFRAAARTLAGQGYGDPEAGTHDQKHTASNASEQQSATERPWPTLDNAALHGLAGDVVRTIEPHTEGDRVALLVNFLAMFGSAVGPSPHARVGASRHRAILFAVHAGETARARKGTAHNETERIVTLADAEWKARVMGGLSSGEGLIHAVRDPIWKVNKDGQEVLADPGVDDKRLLAVEPEFSSVLRVAGREGNTLSELLRRAWDGDTLRTMTRVSPLCATSPHVALLGHVTRAELVRELSETYQANGFANRFLFVCVRRSKELPHGGALPDDAVNALADRVRKALDAARKIGTVRRDDETDRVWAVVYSHLTASRPGMLGAITARAEAQVLRLSLLYALLDGSSVICRAHLDAALALWQYAEDSARFIFGDATGDPVADQILTALRRSGQMTQTQISDLFARNQKSGRLERALAALLDAGLVRTWQGEAASGRPPVLWEATS